MVTALELGIVAAGIGVLAYPTCKICEKIKAKKLEQNNQQVNNQQQNPQLKCMQGIKMPPPLQADAFMRAG